jgi:hypothetical protein
MCCAANHICTCIMNKRLGSCGPSHCDPHLMEVSPPSLAWGEQAAACPPLHTHMTLQCPQPFPPSFTGTNQCPNLLLPAWLGPSHPAAASKPPACVQPLSESDLGGPTGGGMHLHCMAVCEEVAHVLALGPAGGRGCDDEGKGTGQGEMISERGVMRRPMLACPTRGRKAAKTWARGEWSYGAKATSTCPVDWCVCVSVLRCHCLHSKRAATRIPPAAAHVQVKGLFRSTHPPCVVVGG